MTGPTPPSIPSKAPSDRFNASRLAPTLSAGLVIGFLQVTLAIALAALIFAGPLSVFLPRGIGMALAGTIAGSMAIALLTSRPGIIGGNQDVPAAILSVMAAAINSALPGATQESFYTVVVTIILTTLCTGLFFWGVGHLRLGGLARFLPHPVVGGFLAGTGWLLLVGGMGLMVELPNITQPDALLRWLPRLILGLTIFLLLQRTDRPLAIPGLLLVATLLFFGLAALRGLSPAELSAGGWLLGPFPDEALWQPFMPADLASVNWPVILRQAPLLATAILISTVGLLLTTTGMELTINADIDPNQELRAAGISNLLSAPLGGLPGYQQLSLSVLNFKLRVANRLTGLVSVTICLAALLGGASLMGYIPEMIVGGLLIYLSLSFLVPWVIEGWRTLPRIDYAIVITILLVTAVVGFLEAVGVGLLLAVILFVVSYSQIDVVRHELSGQTYQSRVTRSPREEQLLRQSGERIYILQLHGFIFFGTANQLLKRLRARIEDPDLPPLETAILDLERVTGLDFTAEVSFRTMIRLAQTHGFRLMFAGTDEKIRRQLPHDDLAADLVSFEPNLDLSMARCEEAFLAHAAPGAPVSLAEQLQELLPAHIEVEQLLGYFERLDVAAGEHFIREGETADDLYLLAVGQVTAQIERPGQPPVRLQTMRSGRLIGEIGFYLGQPRTADVIADEPSTLYRLTREDLAQMEETHPQAASALHRLMIHILSERVINLTRAVRALER